MTMVSYQPQATLTTPGGMAVPGIIGFVLLLVIAATLITV
jgi:hypothetical protein